MGPANRTPSAWMISLAIFLAHGQIVFFVWVDFSERKWSILAARRRMNALPANSSPGFISPLAQKLVQFLAQKHAMGYRYREEGRALRELDRFLNTRLSPEDPVITLEIVHDYIT